MIEKCCPNCGKYFQVKMNQHKKAFCTDRCYKEYCYYLNREASRAKNNASSRRVRGMNPDEAARIVTAPGGCDICGRVAKKMNLDHDHKTGVMRGKLCINCNMALGHVHDDIGILQKMIEYLSK
jgi:hypothetical protein